MIGSQAREHVRDWLLGVEGWWRRTGLTSTSALLVVVAILTLVAAVAVRPSTTFPEPVPTGPVELRFDDPSLPSGALTRVRWEAHLAPTGLYGRPCLASVTVRVSGDPVVRYRGRWTVALPFGPDVAVAEDVGDDGDSPDGRPRPKVIALPAGTVTSDGQRTLVRPGRSLPLAADGVTVAFVVSRPGSPCLGEDVVVSGRGANLVLDTPPTRVTALRRSGPPPVPPPRVLLVEYSVDGVVEYKPESGDEPEGREDPRRWSWTYSSVEDPERFTVVAPGSGPVGTAAAGPQLIADSLARETDEDRRTFLSGILVGIGAAGLIGSVQEVFTTRRVRRNVALSGAERSFLFDGYTIDGKRSDASRPVQTPNRCRYRTAVLVTGGGMGLAAVAAVAGLIFPVVPDGLVALVSYVLLAWTVGRTEAAGSTGFARLVVAVTGLLSVMAVVRLVLRLLTLLIPGFDDIAAALTALHPLTSVPLVLAMAVLAAKVLVAGLWDRGTGFVLVLATCLDAVSGLFSGVSHYPWIVAYGAAGALLVIQHRSAPARAAVVEAPGTPAPPAR